MQRLSVILAVFCVFFTSVGYPQEKPTFALKQLIFLTNKLDSMSRSFTKKGFTVIHGKRDPLGNFEDSVILQNGSTIIFRMPFLLDSADEDTQILNTYGPVLREMIFTTDSLSLLHAMMYHDSSYFYSNSLTYDTEPTRITITHDAALRAEMYPRHQNNVHRIDWVLLSGSTDVQVTLEKIFSVSNNKKMRGGCCEFYRVGTPFNPTYIRFEPAKKIIPVKHSGFFVVEEGNIYFAY